MFSITDSWNFLYKETIQKKFTASERLASSFERVKKNYFFYLI